MNIAPIYEIFAVEPLSFTTSPVIVVTVQTNPGGYLRGEWFLLVPENEGMLFAQRVSLNDSELPPGYVTFDGAWFLNELREQAVAKLRSYIFETREHLASSYLRGATETLRTDESRLVHMWMRGLCITSLVEMARTTECEPLIKFLDWVGTLPRLQLAPVPRRRVPG